MRPLQPRHAPPALAVAVLLFAFALGTPPAADAAQGDFAGLVDIGGGRRLYLECRGTGSPAVVLEAGYRSSARILERGPPPVGGTAADGSRGRGRFHPCLRL